MILRIIILLFIVGSMGCGSAHYTFNDGAGKIITIDYNVLGKREFNKVEIDPTTGLIKIGSSSGEAGEALTEAIKRIPIPPIIP